MKSNLWFKRRRFGYGWTPSTWEGWAVLGVYLLIVLIPAFILKDAHSNSANKEAFFYLGYVLIATGCLLLITYKKGPKPKWRLGKKSTDNPDEDF